MRRKISPLFLTFLLPDAEISTVCQFLPTDGLRALTEALIEELQMDLDHAIVATYVEIDVPADQLVLHDDLGDRFVDAVRQKTAQPIDAAETKRRLITLRKMGRLPRLRRSR